MSTRERVMSVSPEQVWRVLADGWLFPLFVVGATRMREVDESWPEPGAQLHHSVGVWPLTLDGTTQVMAAEPGRSLRLQARGWPMGEAVILMELEPHTDGTTVRIHEDVDRGPGRLLPKHLRDLQLSWRNVETLRRLAFIAERRTQ